MKLTSEKPSDTAFPAPLRKQVAWQAVQALLEMLERPEFGPTERIPAERDLAEHLGISRMTLRKALQILIDRGVLERRGNRGTFVTAQGVERPLNTMARKGIAQVVEQAGARPGSKLLYFEQTAASARVARLLKIQEGDVLLTIRRLRTVDQKPFCIETSYIPAAKVPELVAADLIEGASLYAMLSERYQIEIESDEGTLSVATMNDQEARLLEVEPGTAALVYRGVIFDTQGQPVEYLVSVNHPQRVVFKLADSRINGFHARP
ncbi:GntR family transcriptional regulator [Pseudomonas viridiflava]|uniref:GntR family transcriptional regulator n=1 Tax=Pseudomonas viridiflava TaxID=33069 RepID=UPI001C2D1BCA|nr:GntR family transcriptional regulator [Pseudomonas viridiflava]MBV1812407.1 GntR family transcriptional regulator [Pseudomonas viridiflava]